jgi:hypothetical protein
MQPSTVALIGALVAVVGTLGGGFLGQRMNKGAQREQWVRDKRKEESRELMIAGDCVLTKHKGMVSAYLNWRIIAQIWGSRSAEKERVRDEIHSFVPISHPIHRSDKVMLQVRCGDPKCLNRG